MMAEGRERPLAAAVSLDFGVFAPSLSLSDFTSLHYATSVVHDWRTPVFFPIFFYVFVVCL